MPRRARTNSRAPQRETLEIVQKSLSGQLSLANAQSHHSHTTLLPFSLSRRCFRPLQFTFFFLEVPRFTFSAVYQVSVPVPLRYVSSSSAIDLGIESYRLTLFIGRASITSTSTSRSSRENASLQKAAWVGDPWVEAIHGPLTAATSARRSGVGRRRVMS